MRENAPCSDRAGTEGGLLGGGIDQVGNGLGLGEIHTCR